MDGTDIMGDTDQLLYKLIISQLTHDGHRHIAGIIKDTLGISYDMPPSSQLKKLVKVCVKWGRDIVDMTKPAVTVTPTIKTEVEHPCVCSTAAPSNQQLTNTPHVSSMMSSQKIASIANVNNTQLATTTALRGTSTPHVSGTIPRPQPSTIVIPSNQSIASSSTADQVPMSVQTNIKTEPVSPENSKDMMVEGEGNDFVCYDCGKSFQAECYLKVHFTKVHKQDKQFSCPQCSKTFAEERYLITHMKYHETYRPFVCQLCQRGFMKPSDLRRHLMIHTGERPYSCDVCGKGFIQFTSLATHRRKHFGSSKIRDAAKARSLRKYRKFRSGMQGDAIQATPLADSLLDVSTSLSNLGTGSADFKQSRIVPKNDDDVDVISDVNQAASEIMSCGMSQSETQLRILQQLLPQNTQQPTVSYKQSSYAPTQTSYAPTQSSYTESSFIPTQISYTPTQTSYTPTRMIYTPQISYTPTQMSYTPTQMSYTPTQLNNQSSSVQLQQSLQATNNFLQNVPEKSQEKTPDHPPLILKIPRSLATLQPPQMTPSSLSQQNPISQFSQNITAQFSQIAPQIAALNRPLDNVITLISDESSCEDTGQSNLTQL